MKPKDTLNSIPEHERSTDKSHFHHTVLAEDEAVVWFEQQVEKKRVKRNAASNHPRITDPLFK